MPTATPTAEEFYNLIMGMIEPDLCLGVDTDTLYPDETPEQKEKRMASYDEAFTIFDAVLKDCDHSITTFTRNKEETAEHEQELKAVEQNFDDTDA